MTGVTAISYPLFADLGALVISLCIALAVLVFVRIIYIWGNKDMWYDKVEMLITKTFLLNKKRIDVDKAFMAEKIRNESYFKNRLREEVARDFFDKKR